MNIRRELRILDFDRAEIPIVPNEGSARFHGASGARVPEDCALSMEAYCITSTDHPKDDLLATQAGLSYLDHAGLNHDQLVKWLALQEQHFVPGKLLQPGPREDVITHIARHSGEECG